MSRTITVKGMGKFTAVPDYVAIYMSLITQEMDYEKTIKLSAEKIEQINNSLEAIGFEKKSVKTTSFNVSTDYDQVTDKDGNFKSVFNGYVCSHRLKVEFDLDNKKLVQTLCAISKCVANPEMSVSFTIKNPTAIKKELLKSATCNAKEKAQILCEASGVKLGELLSINYNWGELNIVSKTNYMLKQDCICTAPGVLENMNIEPDNIDISDTATFVWEIR